MPHAAEIGPIARTLGHILAGEPLRRGALTVIPMLAPMLAEPEWLTLAEAGDWVQVTEVDEAGSVPTLTVANMAGRCSSLMAFPGGQQARCGTPRSLRS